MATIKLGELLVKAKVLQESQLRAALVEQQKWGGKLGDILVRMQLISEDLVVRGLARQLGLQAVNLDAVQGVPPAVLGKVSQELAKELGCVPLQLLDNGKTLVVAMSEPQNVRAIDKLQAISRCRISTQLAGRNALGRAITRLYEGGQELSDAEGSFKVLDSQGRTMAKDVRKLFEDAGQPLPPDFGKKTEQPKAPVAAAPSVRSEAPGEVLRKVEEAQRTEVATLKAMVELMIEKGIFTRDEYLAKVKRS